MIGILRKAKLVTVLLILSMLTVLFTGCGQSQTMGDNKTEKKAYTVGVVLASSTNPLYVSMKQGIEKKGNELGLNLRFIIVEDDQTRQINAIQDLITAKVDALLVSPISMEGAIPSYEAAKKAGIPIISVARTIKRPDLETTYVGMDIIQEGRNTGEWLAKYLNGKGKVAMLKGVAGASFTMDLEKGFKEVLAKYPDIKIVGEVNSAITKEQGLKNTENFLTANPQLDAVYSANDELALGAVQAVEAVNRLKTTIVTGFGGTPPGLASIKDGKISATIANRPLGWGVLAIQTVQDALDGKKIPYPVNHQTRIVEQKTINEINPEDLK